MRRERVVPEQVARRLGHRRDGPLRLEEGEEAGVLLEAAVGEVEGDVAVDAGLRRRVAALLDEDELRVGEGAREVRRGPDGAQQPRVLLLDRRDVGLRDVVERAVRVDPEVAERHRLVAVDGQPQHEEGELAGELPALPLHEVLGLGVVGVEQARGGGADQLQALGEPLASARSGSRRGSPACSSERVVTSRASG